MSVTAASGFVASGVRAGIRRSGLDLALVRSVTPAVGAAVWTTNRVLAAPVVVSKRHLERAEPQAVVVNAGVANAATGPGGVADAEATAAEAADALGLSRRAGGRPLDGRDRRAAADGASARRRARRRFAPRRGCGTARRAGDSHDGSRAEGGARHRGRLRRRRDGEGRGDDPSPARDDARRRHDGLPARGRRGVSVPARRSRRELQPHLGGRRLLDERRCRPARERGQRRRRGHLLATRRSPRLSTTSVRRWRARSSPTERERRCSSRSTSRAPHSDAEAEAVARRIATSPLVKTAAFGRRSELGPCPRCGGFGAVERRLRAPRPRSPHGRVRRRRRVTSAAGRPARRRSWEVRRSPIELDLGLGTGRALVSRLRPDVRLRPPQRGVHDVSRVVVKLGGAGRGDVARARPRRHAAGDEVVVVHGAGPQITAELEARGIPVAFVGGRRVTDADGARGRARVVSSPSEPSSARRSARSPSISSATRSASRPCRVRGARPRRRPAARAGLPPSRMRSATGRHPGRRLRSRSGRSTSTRTRRRAALAAGSAPTASSS